jgi:chromosome segregation ATPase
VVDSRFFELQNRSKKLHEQNAENERLEQELRNQRLALEQSWEAKMSRSEELLSKSREIETLDLAVKRELQEVLELRQQLGLFTDQKEQIQRRLTNMKRDLESTERVRKEVSTAAQRIDSKKAALAAGLRKLAKRRQKLEVLAREVEDLERTERPLSANVEGLESRTKDLEATNSVVISQMREESTEISIALSEWEECSKSGVSGASALFL